MCEDPRSLTLLSPCLCWCQGHGCEVPDCTYVLNSAPHFPHPLPGWAALQCLPQLLGSAVRWGGLRDPEDRCLSTVTQGWHFL